MSAGKCFIDTNIFVYALDSSAVAKQNKAKEIIHRAINDSTGIISYQLSGHSGIFLCGWQEIF